MDSEGKREGKKEEALEVATISKPSPSTDHKRKRENAEEVIKVKIVSSSCECNRPQKTPKISIKFEGKREESEELVSCPSCSHCPCVAIVEEILISTVGGKSNKEKRFELYRTFAKILKFKRKRSKLPSCIVEAVREKWPEERENYVGFSK
jgi:hypothetical protein